MDFQPTALQKQICVESLNRFKAGAGDELQDNPGALYVVILVLQESLRAIAAVGRAAVRGGISSRETMMNDYVIAQVSMPNGTAGMFRLLSCLWDAYQPDDLYVLDEASMRAKFVALSEVANGL